MRKVLCGLLLLLAATLALWLVILDRQGRLVWDHWDEVKRGILYRSGQLTSAQLAQAVKRYDIRTVVNLQWPGDEMVEERSLAASLGVDFVNLPMPGDGFGEEWEFREILQILDDPARRPVLVHCARGTCRTGAAVGIYRLERDGWTLDDVATEMRRQTYRAGWLPGYIYALAKNKPALAGAGPSGSKTETGGERRALRRPPVSSETAEVGAMRRQAARLRTFRWDLPAHRVFTLGSRTWARLAIVALGLGFVITGADNLDLGPIEARLGLASREHFGPLGQVLGYWAPDLWPAEVLPSRALSLLQPVGESSSGAVRWPAAIAGVLAGLILVKGMARRQGKARGGIRRSLLVRNHRIDRSLGRHRGRLDPGTGHDCRDRADHDPRA